MQHSTFKNVEYQLATLLRAQAEASSLNWLNGKIDAITVGKSAKDLFMTYSMLNAKMEEVPLKLDSKDNTGLEKYLGAHNATLREGARLHLLRRVLEADSDFFTPHVAKIIQVADKNEFATFLKYLILLPNPEDFKNTAVEALRTNIATVFDAISLNNAYPGQYFSEAQWNQMYLKAAFMQRPLEQINDVDTMANKDLARIISDYAHERWAAGREVDPYFWRPVGGFLDDTLRRDMERLFESESQIEHKAAALCCFYSDNGKARELLEKHGKLREEVENGEITWNSLKD